MKGDLFADGRVSVYGHGCNCAGAMGKGIAIEFKKRWPKMYHEYRKRCKQGEFGLGDVFFWQENGRSVFNLGTQKHWKGDADLDAIQTSLERAVKIAEEKSLTHIAMPRLGAGLGGLSWDDVRSVLEDTGALTKVSLIICETYAQGQKLIDI